MGSITDSLSYLTADLAGIGGTIKCRPEDFFVEELPLYEAVGEGEHLVLFIQKRRQTTSDVIRRLAKIFHLPRRDVGYAGLKDKHAVTRQHFSVHVPDPTDDEKCLSRIQFTPFDLLWARRHRNKLRRGHLRGNRFVIYIRDVDPSSVLVARRVVDQLVRTGVPNYVGHQRFGYRQSNHIWGRHLLLGEWTRMLDHMLGGPDDTDGPMTRAGREAYDRGDYRSALDAWPRQLRHDRQALDALRQGWSAQRSVLAIDRQQLEFLISALQSSLFNDVLDRRVRDGLFTRLVPGDLAWMADNRSVFEVDAPTAECENAPDGRMASLEVSPSGPMWGRDRTRAKEDPGRWETEAVAARDMSPEDFMHVEHVDVLGSRRPLRVALSEPEVSGGADDHGPYLRLSFDLPRGSFATVALREIMKNF